MKQLFLLACLLGALAVAIGAFGAHGIKPRISPEQFANYQTGVSYHVYHTLAMLAALLLGKLLGDQGFTAAAWAFFVGILCFSGSLYLLSTRELTGIGWWRLLGPITPLGGLAFIAGWLIMLWRVWRTM